MKTEQFARAQEIVNRVKYLSQRRDQLKSINECGIQHVEFKTYDRGTASHIYFKLDDNTAEKAIELQPGSIAVLLNAFIQTSIAVYQREIDELEKEFGGL